jgi:8-oxo-dGTP pyrophosphatase MutT (NUDIX family)
MQVGAACTRVKDGQLEILLITGRKSGRWVIPKGWQMKALSNGEAASIEAWEEAGVIDAARSETPLGTYISRKRLKDGTKAEVEVVVFHLKVKDASETYPEAKQRQRAWFSPTEAASHVREPELKKILLDLT